jgi:ABC-type sugar transport system substrate-binding protein
MPFSPTISMGNGPSTIYLSGSTSFSLIHKHPHHEEEACKPDITIVHVDYGGDTNADQQISQLRNLIQHHVGAISVGATDANAIKAVVDQAVAPGIPVVGLSSLPNSDKLASSVGADPHGMRKVQVHGLAEALGVKGKVAMLTGPAGQSWSSSRTDRTGQVPCRKIWRLMMENMEANDVA